MYDEWCMVNCFIGNMFYPHIRTIVYAFKWYRWIMCYKFLKFWMSSFWRHITWYDRQFSVNKVSWTNVWHKKLIAFFMDTIIKPVTRTNSTLGFGFSRSNKAEILVHIHSNFCYPTLIEYADKMVSFIQSWGQIFLRT